MTRDPHSCVSGGRSGRSRRRCPRAGRRSDGPAAAYPPAAGRRADPDVLTTWLSDRADLFDRIATATADPGLADDARAVAAAARHTLADLTAPALPLLAVALPGGAA